MGARGAPPRARGGKQIRAANLRHGLFSQAREIVLPALGEDAEQFASLRLATYEAFPGADPSEVESLAEALWRLERARRRLEELDIAIVQSLNEEAEGSPCDDTYAAHLRALTMEACAFRDFMRINDRLLEGSAKHNRATTVLPQKMLKTKGEGNREGQNPGVNSRRGAEFGVDDWLSLYFGVWGADQCEAIAL